MKRKLFLLLVCTFWIGITVGWTQSFSDFMYTTGGELIANMAHPTNTYKSCSYSTDRNTLTVSIEYTEGYTTKVRFYTLGSIVYQMDVLQDTDFYPPFLAVQHLKSAVYSALADISPDTIAELEGKIGSSVREMDGKQLTCLILTLSLLDYFS